MNSLIPRQKVLDAIIYFQSQEGRAPTAKELHALTGVNAKSIPHYLNRLIRDGSIQRKKWSREIVVVSQQVGPDGRSARWADYQPKKKLDGRPPSAVSNQHQARLTAKRAQAGRSGRGAEFVIHGKIKSKRDPELQNRIDMAVAMAKANEQSGTGVDVVRDLHKLRFSTRGLKVTKVG